MEKTEYESRLLALAGRLAKIDATLNHSLYDENHLDCFWYDGNSLIEIAYKGYTICFDVCGDVCAYVYPDGNSDKEPKKFKHPGGGRPFFEDMDCRKVILDDNALKKLDEDGNIDFENNNWINIVVIKEHDGTWDNVSEPDVASGSNLLEAIEANLDHYIAYIDKLVAKAMIHYTKEAWAKEQYKGQWGDTPYNRSRVEAGELPASYIGRRTVMVGGIHGCTLLTEGVHFTVDD